METSERRKSTPDLCRTTATSSNAFTSINRKATARSHRATRARLRSNWRVSIREPRKSGLIEDISRSPPCHLPRALSLLFQANAVGANFSGTVLLLRTSKWPSTTLYQEAQISSSEARRAGGSGAGGGAATKAATAVRVTRTELIISSPQWSYALSLGRSIRCYVAGRPASAGSQLLMKLIRMASKTSRALDASLKVDCGCCSLRLLAR